MSLVRTRQTSCRWIGARESCAHTDGTAKPLLSAKRTSNHSIFAPGGLVAIRPYRTRGTLSGSFWQGAQRFSHLSDSNLPLKTTPRTIKPLSLVFVSFVWAAPALCRAPQTKAPPADDQLNEGIQLFEKGRLKEAVAAFDRFKQTAPQDPRPYFYSGMALTEARELSRAASELQEAVRLSPDQPEYRLYQANVFAQLKQKDAALGALGIFTKQDEAEQLPASWLLLLAEVYLRLDKIDDSLRILDLCGPRYPNDPRVYFDRGKVYVALGRLDLALESFRKSIEKSTDNLAAYFELGKLLYQRNELAAEARALSEQAVQADPKRWDPHGYLAEMFLSSGDFEHAYPHLVKMEEIDPDSVVGNFLMAKYWYGRKDFGRALAYAEKVESSRPGNSELRNLLGNIYVGLGQKERASQEYEAAVHLAPDRADFRENLRRGYTARAQNNQDLYDEKSSGGASICCLD